MGFPLSIVTNFWAATSKYVTNMMKVYIDVAGSDCFLKTLQNSLELARNQLKWAIDLIV
jgi:hypothetical protein